MPVLDVLAFDPDPELDELVDDDDDELDESEFECETEESWYTRTEGISK